MFPPLLNGMMQLSSALIIHAFVGQNIAPLSQAFQQHLICYEPPQQRRNLLLNTWLNVVAAEVSNIWSSEGM